MYRSHAGDEYFIVDGHLHWWDGSPANQKNEYGKGFISCFYDYHSGLSPEEYVWPREKYEKYDLPMAKKLMAAAGSKGFDVTLTTFSTPLDHAALAALIKADLAQIGINVNIVTQDPVTFGAKNSAGDFDWDLTARGMRWRSPQRRVGAKAVTFMHS